MLYPLSYGGRPMWASPARWRAERQCTSVPVAEPLAVAAVTSCVVLFSTRAGRSVERVRGAGGRARRAARAHRLRSAGHTHPSGTAEHAASVERASGRHLLHHCRWTGAATSQSSNENSRVVDLRITVDGAPVEVPAYVGIDRVRARAGPDAYPRHLWPGMAGGPRNRRGHARTVLHGLGCAVR